MAEHSPQQGRRRAPGLVMRGICMGIADVIPGVSGGTVALITGIYDDLVGSLAAVDSRLLGSLFRGRFGEVWRLINGGFLLPLVAGIGVAIFSLARLITYLLSTHPVPVWGFLTGLIAASALAVGRRAGKWRFGLSVAAAFGAAAGYGISIAIPVQTEEGPIQFLLSGAVASVAMILPGISGSFILLLLGKYRQVFGAVADFDLEILVVFGAGFAFGILLFAKILKRLLARVHGPTMAFLVGLMAGSLRRVWPFRDPAAGTGADGERYTCVLPAELGAETAAALALMAAGVLLVAAIEALGRRPRASTCAGEP